MAGGATEAQGQSGQGSRTAPWVHGGLPPTLAWPCPVWLSPDSTPSCKPTPTPEDPRSVKAGLCLVCAVPSVPGTRPARAALAELHGWVGGSLSTALKARFSSICKLHPDHVGSGPGKRLLT